MNGHLKVVEFLHNNRNEGCDRALVYAANSFKCGNLEMVQYLVENGLGVDRIDEALKRYINAKCREYLETIKNAGVGS